MIKVWTVMDGVMRFVLCIKRMDRVYRGAHRGRQVRQALRQEGVCEAVRAGVVAELLVQRVVVVTQLEN